MDLMLYVLRFGTILLISFLFSIVNTGKLMDASKVNSYFKYYFIGSVIVPAIIACFNFGAGLAISFALSFAIQLAADKLTKKA